MWIYDDLLTEDEKSKERILPESQTCRGKRGVEILTRLYRNKIISEKEYRIKVVPG